MKAPRFVSEDEIEIDGWRLVVDQPGNYDRYREDDEALFMAKGQGQIEAYVELARRLEAEETPARELLEIGFFRGGSAVFLNWLFDLERLVCVDREPDAPPLLTRYADEHPGVRLYTGVDQDDAERLLEICTHEFPDGLDLVVDDASHFYEQTKASFEVTFPLLRPGGRYVLEDWSWAHEVAHQDPDGIWAAKNALTNLLFEVLIAHAANSGVVAEVHCEVGFAWFERGPASLPRDGSFRLDDYRLLRGRELPLI